MKTFNVYFHKGIQAADLPLFFRPLEKDEDTPSCHCCGGPLHTDDEVDSEECDKCFAEFVEADLPLPESH